jgi:phosphohistidine swiveling domain-containing protein
MVSRYCHPLSSVEDPEEFGGKASHLGRVHRMGYRVPDSMILHADALRLFLSTNELRESVEAYISNSDDIHMAAAFDSIVAAVERAAMPEVLKEEIRDVAAKLLRQSPCGLAVRSSAVLEDSERASFAGVFESFLGVTNPEEVLEKVISCWCAGWSPRVLRYMNRMGINPVADGMAVILQEVVPAKSSGVIYTADPQSGNPWHFVMHATPGLSLDLLSGSGVGDSFRLEWSSGAVLEREIVTKPPPIWATTEGVRRRTDKSTAPSEPALSDKEAAAVARTARELDEQFGSRLDIEWAIAPEGLCVVQVRPMTALPAFFPISLTTEQERLSWQPALITLPFRGDQLPHLLTPLYCHYSEMEMWHRYQPEDILFTSICQSELDVNGYRYWEFGEQPTFQDYFQGPGDYEAWIQRNEPGYRQRWDQRSAELREIRDAATRGIAETTSAAELIPVLLEVMDRLWDLNAFGWSGPQAFGWMCEAALRYFLQNNQIQADTATLLSGGSDSYTFQTIKALQALGRAIREPGVVEALEQLPLGEVVPHLMQTARDGEFIVQLESFCWRFGKTPPSWLNRAPFWSAGAVDPQIVSTIKNAWLGKSRDVRKLREESLRQRQQYEKTIRAALNDMSAQFDRLLDWARFWGQALNDRHGLKAGLLHERELVWQVGNRLRREGLLERVEDILVLRKPDLERIATTSDPQAWRKTCLERIHEFRRNRRLTPPPVLGAPAQTNEQEAPPPVQMEEIDVEYGVYKGQGFGGGVAVGRARKVVNLLDPHVLESLQESDVLVLPHENAFHYADWHSLLTVLNAVVSPGRPSHHLAQVARECGVPLVGHVTGNLDAIPEGAAIRVDGSGGLVHILKSGDKF